MKHRRYSNKRLKQMLNEVLPERSDDFVNNELVEKKSGSSKKKDPINLEDQQK
ncbi:hypothetical protein [Veronia nyctiphanis]|uniref:hypothetical protein n=1 Tax=Veronia nyctiphanis TaxID=1278244 RepID=UPI00137557ED|nr:hypothetical protein [Veronia nyctiphanis]